MIPNKDQMNTTMPMNTGGGLGFVDKGPSPRPAPPELINNNSPSNASLMNGNAGLGYSMGMPAANMPRPSQMPPQFPAQPTNLGKTKPAWQGRAMKLTFAALIVGTGFVVAKKFTSEDFEAEEKEDF